MSDEQKVSEEAVRADLDARVKSFNEKLIPLLSEYKLGLSSITFLTPDGRIGSKPTLVDDVKVEEKKPEDAVAPEKKEGEVTEA